MGFRYVNYIIIVMTQMMHYICFLAYACFISLATPESANGAIEDTRISEARFMQFHRLILPVVLAAMAGCSSTKLVEPASVATAAPAPAQQVQTKVKTVTLHRPDDPKSSLTKRSVYFDYHSFLVHATDRPLIEAHAKYLVFSRTAMVRIEGNADEREGREYNLALGQKWAEAVLKSLQLLGVPAGEMEAVSFGKEKPVDPGHDETAWAKSRGADLNAKPMFGEERGSGDQTAAVMASVTALINAARMD